MEKIRLATEEEIKEIANESNLTPMSRVLAMGEMRAVWRVAHELDPVHFYGAPVPRMNKFIWGIENLMKGAGVTEYYFNVDAQDAKWIETIEAFGGERLSKQPDYRYRVNL